MKKGWPKIIYDPVHKLITFDDTCTDRLLLNLINTREFQRLRRIKQLGMSDLVFPGATHTRFAHSLGVMHLARKFLDRIQKLIGKRTEEEHRLLILVAALLHDLGHGPFSHSFEEVSGERHEKWAIEIILDPNTEIHQALTGFDRNFPKLLVTFLENQGAIKDDRLPRFFSQIISSQLDTDRFDYLLRDSHATGVDYGIFDLEWLINHLYFEGEKNRFYLSWKAQAVVETYILARYHMYRYVYFHKTTRAAEVMLKLIFKRFQDLIGDQDLQTARQIVPNAPASVISVISKPLELSQFLLLDDYTIMEFLKSCESGADPILRMLGGGLIHRNLFKAIDATDKDPRFLTDFIPEAKQIVKKLGYDPEYLFVEDTPGSPLQTLRSGFR